MYPGTLECFFLAQFLHIKDKLFSNEETSRFHIKELLGSTGNDLFYFTLYFSYANIVEVC